jgi:hypothetical protein
MTDVGLALALILIQQTPRPERARSRKNIGKKTMNKIDLHKITVLAYFKNISFFI